MSSIWGKHFIVDIFGESHGQKIGVVINGVTPGISLELKKIQAFMDRRKAGSEAWSTKRREPDEFTIVSGFANGKTTGTPLCMFIDNTDTRSKDYQQGLNRPGHADYTGNIRYNGFNDPRGGGHFSGRLTAPLVFAGAVAAQILKAKGVFAATHIRQIQDVQDKPFDYTNIPDTLAQELKSMRFPLMDISKQSEMEQRVKTASASGDSVGGVIECAVVGVPAGVGNPIMDSVESRLSSLLFSIPAVKGVSFGAGFGFADMLGSEANDQYIKDGELIKTKTNNNGGVLGGISNGMPIVFQTVIKPTPSVSKPQKTVNLSTKESEIIEIKGRHDPCIVPRAVAVIEAAVCICILDLLMERGL